MVTLRLLQVGHPPEHLSGSVQEASLLGARTLSHSFQCGGVSAQHPLLTPPLRIKLSHPLEKTDLHRFCPQCHSFSHHVELVATG